MIKKFLGILVIAFLFSCEKEGIYTSDAAQEQLNTVNPNEQITTLKSGVFSPTSGITVMGEAVINQQGNVRFVSLENFSISEGPDLKVYLSTSDAPTTFVNLGNLSASQNYVIPQEVDLQVYNYVLIHCQQYNHLFAIASLN